MGWNGLERNKLDFILTDLLPVEVSELFSYTSFYSFLLEKEQQKKLDGIIKTMQVNKGKSEQLLFNNGWSTKPLKYNIMKGNKTLREMSLLQPFSILNLYLFIELYQKEVLDYFEKKHCFSLRYHKKNTSLYYKAKRNSVIEYFQKQTSIAGRETIQQLGNYFRIAPYESINAFSESLIWRRCNFRFRYYAKMDYKACFDSIYTHSFSWIIERNVIDAKNAKNANLFVVIDRILQNINGKSSNGIVVGPEFSRMMAEILLQHIDHTILVSLEREGYRQHKDYDVFRYVDDIFVFANEQKVIDLIIKEFSEKGEKYRLRLNELKLVKDETPCLPKEWLEKTRLLSDTISSFFFQGSKAEYEKLDQEKQFLTTTKHIPIDRIKDEVAVVMKRYPEDRRTVVSYLLSTLLNNISKKKNGYKLFSDNGIGKAALLIDFSFYIYAFFPSFDQTRKIVSIISYINCELDFKKNEASWNKLNNIFHRYSFIFQNGNMFDLCDWLPFLSEYNIHLDAQIESEIVQKVEKNDDPILWANLLLYSQYNSMFSQNVLSVLESIIRRRIDSIIVKEVLLNTEFWYILIFHNCPFIAPTLRKDMDDIITSLRNEALPNAGKPSADLCIIVCDYLLRRSSGGNKPKESFFNWSGIKTFGAQIMYRTYQRTVFKHYKKNRYALYASIT